MLKCLVPVGLGQDKVGNLFYFKCEEEDEFKVGGWLVCANHKKFYTGPHKWSAIPLQKT